MVPRARADERPCFHHSPAQRSLWRSAVPHRVGRVSTQRRWAGTTSIVALDRNSGGDTTLWLEVPKTLKVDGGPPQLAASVLQNKSGYSRAWGYVAPFDMA